jgi:hypothetical protein
MENEYINNNAGLSIESDTVQMQANNIAGGDVIIEENHYETKNGFADINLLPYSDEFYVVPQFAERIVQQLRSNHLLLITGSYGFDKETFVRHVSYRLSTTMMNLKAKEWNAPTDSINDLAKTILEEETPCIFIVNRIGPKDVEFDLDKIKRNATLKSHFILFTSDLTIASWRQPDHILHKHWFEIPDRDLYSKEILQRILIDQFNANSSQISFETTFSSLDNTTALTAKHTIANLSNAFNTPEQIIFFTEMLCMEKVKLSAEKLDALLARFHDNKESMIAKWFRNLDEKEKLLTLGASLFEGLYEDQFFNVMQKVTQDFWHFKNPALLALDYGDLDFAMNFFKFEEYNSSVSVFKGKFPNQRTDIIRAAWNTHRRHIITSLSVLVEVGNDSGSGGSMNSGIHSSKERGMALRSMIAELFSDIAMISIQLVEERLLEFAVTADLTLQRVTAKALARWRLYGKENLLFETLERWHKDQRIKSKITNLQQNKNTSSDRAMSNIGATILLTIGYAAEYDNANNLQPAIIERLTDMASERNTVLNHRLGKVLATLVGKHYQQLKDELPDQFMIYTELEKYIVDGICRAYENDPDAIKQLLSYWFNKCLKDEWAEQKKDKTLIHILKIYQNLSYTGINDVITPEYVWELLQLLYTKELKRSVRNVLVETIGLFVTLDPEYALDQLEKLYTYTELYQREALFSGFVKVYVDQRENLEGADYIIELNGQTYPDFSNKSRPLTAIEKMLYKWLNSDNTFAQQISLLIFIQFAKEFDVPASRRSPQLIYVPNNDKVFTAASGANDFIVRPNLSPVILYEPELSIFNRLWIWWWLLFETPENKAVFRSLLSTILQHKDILSTSDVQFVIRKMKGQNVERYNKVGNWMEKWFSKILQ